MSVRRLTKEERAAILNGLNGLVAAGVCNLADVLDISEEDAEKMLDLIETSVKKLTEKPSS